ncbi:MAG: CHRD domain-containing protein [Chloroflexota bacterium]
MIQAVLGLFLGWSDLLGCAQAQVDDETVASAEEVTVSAEHGHGTASTHKAEIDLAGPIELNPSGGKEIGWAYEAYLSPEQEGGEEEETPEIIPDVFKSTASSVDREERPSIGHGTLSFTKDLSTAYVHIAIENVNPEEINMFHIHCGLPAQLGPILVDFGLMGDPTLYFDDGILSMEILNEDLEAVIDHGEGIVGLRTAGCPIESSTPLDRVRTIAGMQQFAEAGELYFNVHTVGQTYFGEMRGQLHRAEMPTTIQQ